MMQLFIFRMVFEASAKKVRYTRFVYFWILFNPVSLFGGNLHANLGGFNDLLWYTTIYFSIKATRLPAYASDVSPLVPLTVLNLLVCYFDPRFLMVLPLALLQYETRWGAGDS